MDIRRHVLPLMAALAAMLALCASAQAELLVSDNKSAQIMTVVVDGQKLYDWPVSTGGTGYDTPSGAFRPFRMEIDHTSDEYDDAPMPYSIFFTMVGTAVHGTLDERNLGHAVSHGCIRLSVKNAATLWALVKQQKMANTTVVVSGAIPGSGPPLSAVSATLY
jgi:lipoprotein-anchoring transpeptidase ErfK/SrfK